jgi:hypothetical protein
MWTNSSPNRGRELLREMEQLRQILLDVAFPRAQAKGRILVLAFRNADEVAAYVPRQFSAYSWSGRGGIYQPLIAVNADAEETDHRVLTHELTHVISYAVIEEQPRWFAEGLAGFFETAKLDPGSSLVNVGAPLELMTRRVRELGLTPMTSMFSCTELACMDDRYYATAWALMSYLANTHAAALLRYQARLSELSGAEQSTAWTEVFPALTPDKLDHVVRDWFFHGPHQVWHYPVALKETQITERPIGDAELYAARGLLRYYADRSGREPPEIATAVKLDATNMIAQLVRAAHARASDPDVARALVAAHPEDWRAWWMLAFALRTGDEAHAARIKLCALAPNPSTLPPDLCASPIAASP